MPLSFQHQEMGWNQYTPSVNKHIKTQIRGRNNLNLSTFLIGVVCLKRIMQHLKTEHSVNQEWKNKFLLKKITQHEWYFMKRFISFWLQRTETTLWDVTTCSMTDEHRSPNWDLVLQIQRIKYFSSRNRVTSRSAL